MKFFDFSLLYKNREFRSFFFFHLKKKSVVYIYINALIEIPKHIVLRLYRTALETNMASNPLGRLLYAKVPRCDQSHRDSI